MRTDAQVPPFSGKRQTPAGGGFVKARPLRNFTAATNAARATRRAVAKADFVNSLALPVCLLLALLLSGCAGRGPAPEHGDSRALRLPPASSAQSLPDQPAALSRPAVSRPPLDIGQRRSPQPLKDPVIPETWRPLLDRLAAEGLDGDDVRRIFAALGDTYSPKPMGTKIKELFTAKYLRTPPEPGKPAKPAPSVYPGFVTPATIAACRGYLQANAPYFALCHELYDVPAEIAVALLMVETKLGSYLGTDNAFWSLACMAAADSPERIAEPLARLPVTPERLAWVQARLAERSAWAYKELKALLAHIRAYGFDPLNMPGSVYGAIGICQFMPSNLKPYGVDGDNDGTIDLFAPADAIPSVGSYLKGHGWKHAMTRAQQHAAVKKYNNSNTYANTILALAEAIAASAGRHP